MNTDKTGWFRSVSICVHLWFKFSPAGVLELAQNLQRLSLLRGEVVRLHQGQRVHLVRFEELRRFLEYLLISLSFLGKPLVQLVRVNQLPDSEIACQRLGNV